MSRRRRRRPLGLLFLILLVASAVVGGLAYRDWVQFSDAPLTQTDARVLDVPNGSSFLGIVRLVRQQGLSAAPELYWRALALQMQVTSQLHAGEYAVPVGTTPRTLLARMAKGDVIQHHFTIVEGWTFRHLREQLAAHPDLAKTVTTLSDAELMAKLDMGGAAAEGWFLPETYTWTRGDSDLDILRRANTAMKRTLEATWAQRVPDLPYATPYEALVMASIVERETGRADERPAIAGVFVRRLKLGMKLQTDPTVIYGLGASFDGNLRRRDLETDTPYNTYTRTGLPPTPIALPGLAALRAAVQPAPGDALYFVARGDGSHEFSANLEAHNRAVARYQLKRSL
ncbi:endolytic transglycosylase MltG [Tahibacter amnicola]|uniref:Endolytic murein transglycosylase n=1 Tax=Tahibacter amnicola TaxID=2976241 RepID=A0ABY6BI20_9GAMM|nr:endolytic transglycosylase MltG [Tahibacter amnicola]UXI69651.1 endolytic transglycosylase MltG [Tahibacter amnicola]